MERERKWMREWGKKMKRETYLIVNHFCFSSLAVTPGLVEPHLEGKSLKSALSSNRMFIIDLTYLEGVECKGGKKVDYFIISIISCIVLWLQLYFIGYGTNVLS